jgi:drug/metabolite transporter (DMT)-like permease
MENQTKAYWYAGFAIFFWSTVASAFKIALRYLDFLQLLMFASITSLLFLFLVILIQRNLKFFLSLKIKDVGKSIFLGFLNPYLYYIILFKAYTLLPAQVAQPLNMVWPIVLVFLSVPLLKHKVSRRSFVALFISFIGVYFISSQGNLLELGRSNPLGVALAVGSSLIWSFFWIFNVKDKRQEEVKLFLNFFFAVIFITLTNLLLKNFKMPNIHGILSAIYVGLFEMGLTFLLWLKALKFTKSVDKISNFVYLAPFLSLIFIHIFIGETIYITTVIGLTLIIGGIFFQKLR